MSQGIFDIAAEALDYFAAERRWQRPTTSQEAQANRLVVHLFKVYAGVLPPLSDDNVSASQARDMAERIRRTWINPSN